MSRATRVPRNLTAAEKKKLHFFGAFINEQIYIPRTELVGPFFEAMVSDAATRGGAPVPAYFNKLDWSGKYNVKKKKWEGGIIGSDLSPEDERIALTFLENGSSDHKENYFDRGRERIGPLLEHIDALRQKKTRQPFFFMCQLPGHYNACFVAVDPETNVATGYYFEPHNIYDYREALNPDYLPYGVVVEDLSALLGIEMVGIPCPGRLQENQDTMCQTWSTWFVYLMAYGLSYDEARMYQAKRRFSGLLGFTNYALALQFTAYKVGRGGKRGAVVFTGSLIDGSLDGKRTNLMVAKEDQILARQRFGITESRPIKTVSLEFYPPENAQTRPTAGTKGEAKFTDRTVPTPEIKRRVVPQTSMDEAVSKALAVKKGGPRKPSKYAPKKPKETLFEKGLVPGLYDRTFPEGIKVTAQKDYERTYGTEKE